MRSWFIHFRGLPARSTHHRRELRTCRCGRAFCSAGGRLAAGRPSTGAAVPGSEPRCSAWVRRATRPSALVALTGASGTELLAAWSGPGATWSTSSPLVIGQNEEVASFGVGPGRALFALLEGTSEAERLALAQAGRAAWQQLPPPPQGTETVAFGTKGSTDALVASGTKFSAWSLKAGWKRWAEDQVTDVAIQYGSSS